MNIKICKVCNMMYCSDLPVDVAQHNRLHQQAVEGIPTNLVFSRLLLATMPDDQIAVVAHNRSPFAEKQLAEDVAWVAKQSLGRWTGFNWYRYIATETIKEELDCHLLLYLRAERVIGMVAVCRRAMAYQMTWDNQTPNTIIDHSHWCIQMIWTAHHWRKAGIAKALVTPAADHLDLPDATHFAWSAPFTDGGEALVRHFCPVEFLIA